MAYIKIEFPDEQDAESAAKFVANCSQFQILLGLLTLASQIKTDDIGRIATALDYARKYAESIQDEKPTQKEEQCQEK